MAGSSHRIAREGKTVGVMVAMYCRAQHASKELCPECSGLLRYALERLSACPFREGKTTCARCPVHCFRPEMREKVRLVMRYSGPRMAYRHPLMALLHLLDQRRKARSRPGD